MTRATFQTSKLPSNLKALVKLTGCKARTVSVEFQSGPTSVSLDWRADRTYSTGTILSCEVNDWTGSDGESNSTTTEVWTAPVAYTIQEYTPMRKGLRVVIGNLGELCPDQNKADGLTTADLAALYSASVQTQPAPVAAPVEVHTVSPGPFNELKTKTAGPVRPSRLMWN